MGSRLLSVTGVEVFGDVSEDLAFAVHFGDDGIDEAWFSRRG